MNWFLQPSVPFVLDVGSRKTSGFEFKSLAASLTSDGIAIESLSHRARDQALHPNLPVLTNLAYWASPICWHLAYSPFSLSSPYICPNAFSTLELFFWTEQGELLLLTFLSTSLHIQKICCCSCYHLHWDSTTSHIFFPAISASFLWQFPIQSQEKQHLSFHLFQGSEQSFHIKQWFTCTSPNHMYCIWCSQCGLLHYGETKPKMYVYSVNWSNHELPVAHHFKPGLLQDGLQE